MKKQRIYVCLVIILLLIVDQHSKYLFYNQEIWISLPFIDPFLNTGISWGIPMPQLLITSISLFCIILFGVLYFKKLFTFREVSLFMAGTMGNLLDRRIFWGVRDFIAIGNFPIFNVADAFLTIAVALFCIKELLLLQKRKKTLSS